MKEQKLTDFEVFNNEEFGEIRGVIIDDIPYFAGKDVARALGYSNTKDALLRHVDIEDKLGSRFPTPAGSRELVVVNESGIYSLILKSKLPSAKKFKRWVTSEVLPSIRKHGMYITQEKLNLEKEELLKEVEQYRELNRGSEYRSGIIMDLLSYTLQSCVTTDPTLARVAIEFGLKPGHVFQILHDGFVIDILEDGDKDRYHWTNDINWCMNDKYEGRDYTTDVSKNDLDSNGDPTSIKRYVREFTSKAYELIRAELIAQGYSPVVPVKTRKEIIHSGSDITKIDPRDFIVALERPKFTK